MSVRKCSDESLTMASQNCRRAEVLVARSKRTGERYPLRITHLVGADNNQLFEKKCSGSFHYLKKDKSIVCRCHKTHHFHCRRVYNPKIEGLCHQFFLMLPSATTCSREQWRAMCNEVSESSEATSMSQMRTDRPASRQTSLRRNPFEHKSPSMVGPLTTYERQSFGSELCCFISASCQHSLQSRPLSMDGADMHYLSNGLHGETDVPEDVWRASRPSVHLSRHSTGSVTSTPLGSAATPVQHGVSEKPVTRIQAPELLPTYKTLASMYEFADVHDSTILNSPYGNSRDSVERASQCSSHHYTSGFDVTDLQIGSSETSRSRVRGLAVGIVGPAEVAELPFPQTVTELDATPPSFHSHHSPTLRELEARSVDHLNELAEQSLNVPHKIK